MSAFLFTVFSISKIVLLVLFLDARGAREIQWF
jgi:hypothetical protein